MEYELKCKKMDDRTPVCFKCCFRKEIKSGDSRCGLDDREDKNKIMEKFGDCLGNVHSYYQEV